MPKNINLRRPMKPISDYNDYRLYIRDFYEERKLMTGLSWRGFNKMAGYASTKFLKLVCDGKSKLSSVGATRLAKVMGLSKVQTTYFLALVTYGNTSVERKKQAAFELMQSIAKEEKVRIVGDDAYDYYKDWWNPILRELAPRVAVAIPAKIAGLFYENVSSDDVRKSLDFMVQAGFLKKHKKNYEQTDKAILGSSEKIPKAIRNMHRQMARFAEKAIENFPVSDRNFSGMTVSVNRTTYEQIVNELNICRKKIAEIVSVSDDCDRIYRLNLQLFPLTKEIEK